MRVAPTGWLWSALAALGASYIVAGITFAVLDPLLTWVFRLDEFVNSFFYGPRTIGLSGIDSATTLCITATLAAIAATVVARKSDGRAAVALYAALVAITAASTVLRAFESQRRIATDPNFYIVTALDLPSGAALTFLPALIVVIGGLVAPTTRRGATAAGTNAFLECAGAYAVVGMAASVVLLPAQSSFLLFAPYVLTSLDAGPRAMVVVAQALAAGLTYALRSRFGPSASRFVVLLAVGIAAVLPTDITPFGLGIVYGSTYVPVSLLVVPIATSLIVVAASLARQAMRRSRPGGAT